MRHLLIGITLTGCTVVIGPARAAPAVGQAHNSGTVTARLGVLAMETGATTRAPALEAAVGGRWYGLEGVAACASYRGGLRDAGGKSVSMRSLHHRFGLGLRGELGGEVLFVGMELGAHALLASTHLSAPVGPDIRHSRWSWGPAVDLFAGLRLTRDLRMTVEVGGYGRGALLDLTMGLGMGYALPGD